MLSQLTHWVDIFFISIWNNKLVQWDLVCENSVWRTAVQVALSVGKFLGATTFGIISDKYGRRTSCTIGAALHILGGVLTTFSPWYWFFLLGRFALGASSSGLFYAGFALCMHCALCSVHWPTKFLQLRKSIKVQRI